ncbi:amino acid/polyamine/organocation transporter (APC superfamily) [Asanoa ferruginea]|uniref:Amino acid/polyamine/organocation transporter (APC superfamily) n=1 Tax=Asanoa ferruginea TaxID=53367 RepID=A0A3D9ZX70_9ACTN|nr:amino acid/polyamine/organocation transporter (APC superfamily) [Asanoa ferruginea]
MGVSPPVLHRGLSSGQMGMLTIGSVIGTGLFLGSGLAVSMAGPTVLLAYLVAAVLAVALTYAAIEMAAANPDLNGFGAFAYRYLGPLAGFAQRWLYWGVVVISTGTQAVAVGIYVRYWWPQVPLWIPVALSAAAVVVTNLFSVRAFGTLEYWFSAIKVSAIVAFLVLGVVLVTVGLPNRPAVGLTAFTDAPSYLPQGITGLAVALVVASFSFGGTETLALAAAESRNPSLDLARTARWTILRLCVFYLLGMAIVVCVAHAVAAAPDGELTASPFVRVFDWAGLPIAAAAMNFVVLTAALSALNAIVYVSTRTLFSLAVDGQAPRWATRVNRRGVPVNAVAASAVGLPFAVTVALVSPDDAFAKMLGIVMFGAITTWVLIFATHASFRRRRTADEVRRSPLSLPGGWRTSASAAVAMAAVAVGMLFIDIFRTAWTVGAPSLLAILAAYAVVRMVRDRRGTTRPGGRRGGPRARRSAREPVERPSAPR